MFTRYTFAGLSAAFVICLLVQIFMAGMAIFVHPNNWVRHVTFIHFFEILPLLMLVFGWLGKLPKQLLWQSAGLFGLIFLQYFTANIRAVIPLAAAAHPVTALPLIGLAFVVMREAWKITKDRRSARKP